MNAVTLIRNMKRFFKLINLLIELQNLNNKEFNSRELIIRFQIEIIIIRVRYKKEDHEREIKHLQNKIKLYE